MDNVLRFEHDYPSLHTMAIASGFKLLDIIIVVLFITLMMDFLFSRRRIGVSPTLLFLLLIGVINTVFSFIIDRHVIFDFQYFLFVARGLILFFVIHQLSLSIETKDLEKTIKLALLTCIFLMFFSHIFHSDNPMERLIFGFRFVVAFAGDEYGSVGLLIASLILLGDKKYRSHYIVATICFFLAVFAGRKSAIPYFFFVFMMIYWSSNKKIDPIRRMAMISEHLYIVLALFFIKFVNVEALNFSFAESLGILNATIDSLATMLESDWSLLFFGISPFMKYPIYNLDSIFDHAFAFGGDAGELFKIKLWFFPFDRTYLNFGIIIPTVIIIRHLFFKNHSSASFYISSYSFYLLFFNATSIIMCVSIALALSSIKHKNNL